MTSTNLIHILPESVANQIAAGEVIQRPASVIKELVENAIDANATSIIINLREGGSELIQVIDDGKGMSSEDAVMAFQKHATSKIRQADDLFDLHTFGFRGEALASVAAVAEVELHTRRAEDETGTWVSVASGEVLRQESCACSVGSNFEVRNLFYNIPARRKFLKAQSTELSNILLEVQRVAMVNPGVAIQVQHNGKQILSLDSGSDLHRIEQLFGSVLASKLIPINVDNELMTISGFITRPEESVKKNRQQMLFVNGRYVKSSYFHKALLESYLKLIPEGTQPHYFIHLQVDPASIDVNICPSKTEVKFENESIRYHILTGAVHTALNSQPELKFPSDEFSVMPGDVILDKESDHTQTQNTNPFRQASTDFLNKLSLDFQNESQLNPQRTSGQEPKQKAQPTSATLPNYAAIDNLLNLEQQDHYTPQGLTQVKNRYIMGSHPDGLLLVDQHRAHLRVLYNRFYQQIRDRKGVSQRLAFPQTIEIATSDMPHFESVLPTLSYIGFELDSLGSGSFAVNGYPAAMESGSDFQMLMNQMVDTVRDGVHGLGEELDQQLALRMAQAQAVPYGRKLDKVEITTLIDSLLSLPDHNYTPDGHSIMKVLNCDVLSKLL